jgi:hypothetical protein
MMNAFTINPSALAYLFGDGLENLFAGRSRLPFNETLPCREVKVKSRDLPTAMLMTAFVHLLQRQRVRLTLESKGRILKKRFVLASLASGSGAGFDGFEGQILGSIQQDAKHNDVPTVVWRLWRSDVTDPFSDVIRMGRQYLLELGYYTEGERRGIAKILGAKLVPKCDKILALRAEADAVRDMVVAFRAEQPELYEQLWKDVAKGISSRQESQDVDMDF